VPPAGAGWRGRFAASVQRIVAPLFERQQAFNSAVVDHINRNAPGQRHTREAIEGTVAVLRDQRAEIVRFQSLLVMFLQQITPYVDTRDRNGEKCHECEVYWKALARLSGTTACCLVALFTPASLRALNRPPMQP